MMRIRSRSSDASALEPRVQALLSVAAEQIETAGPLPGESEALAAFRASAHRTRTTSMITHRGSARSAMASAIGAGVLLAGGVGATAAGVLPGAAQEKISTWLGNVGISVPAGDGADEKGDLRGGSEQSPGEDADENGDLQGRSQQGLGEEADEHAHSRGSHESPADERLPSAAKHGERVSDTAKNTTANGVDKGKDIAGVASDDRVQSGDRDSAGENRDGLPASTPNPRGTDRRSDATDGGERSAGAVGEGTTTADESSNGASSNGSGDHPAGH